MQGDVQTASVSTYMAINGSGFFVVQKPGSFSDNQPVFDGRRQLHPPRRLLRSTRTATWSTAPAIIVEGVPIDPATGNTDRQRRRRC